MRQGWRNYEVHDIMSKAADLHTCVQNRIFCEETHGDDSRRAIIPLYYNMGGVDDYDN